MDRRINAGRREARSASPDRRIVRIRTEGRGRGVYQTALVGIVILLQVTLILVFYFGFLNAFRWYQAVAFALSIICVLHVLSTEKSGYTKTIWVLFLLILFYFGYIAYFLSSEKVFFYPSKKRYAKIFKRTEKYTPQYALNTQVLKTVKRDSEYLYNAGGFPPYTSSEVKYFCSGGQAFDDIIKKLESAEKFIFMEFFIIAEGILLNRISDILCDKALSGVEVRIIGDGFGSHGKIPHSIKKRWKKCGVKFKKFNKLVLHFTFALNLRDHRKIVVVDGKTAYIGGYNLADEYINIKRMHGYWKDSGVRICGDAVDGYSLMFLRQWEFITKKEEDYSPFLGLYEKVDGGSVVIPYADGKDYEGNIAKDVYLNIMSGAQEKLYIMTPYFIPDEDTANMLALKARSGVDVRIILPDVPDKSYVYAVSVDNAERLLKSGVKLYKMRRSFVHSKVVLSENCASVGSANIDLRSYYNQFENGVYAADEGFVQEIAQDFERVFEASIQITEEYARRNKTLLRLVAGILRILSPMM